MRGIAALLLLAALGCSNDLDALYGQAGADAVDVDALPLVPVEPNDERLPDCEACAVDECATERASCLEDSHCMDVLRCRGTCDDPECLRLCDAEHGFSPWYDDFDACVWRSCEAKCGEGDNWACTGEYALQRATDAQFELELRFRSPQRHQAGARVAVNFLPGADVRACEASTGCDPVEEVRSDLSVSLGLWDTSLPAAGFFEGFVEVEAPEADRVGYLERLVLPPLGGPSTWRLAFLPPWALPQADRFSSASESLPVLHVAEPRLVVYSVDCTGRPARDSCFELVDEPDAAPLYLDRVNLLAAAIEACGSRAAFAIFPNLPERPLHVRGTHRVTGELLFDRAAIPMRAGWTTHAYVWPRRR